MESLMWVHPNDVKRSPPLFTAIAKRDESLVRFICSFMLKSALESSQVPVCQGIALWSNWTKPLTWARYGTKVRGRVSNDLENIDFLEVGGVKFFFSAERVRFGRKF
jgi:hypothetical protein